MKQHEDEAKQDQEGGRETEWKTCPPCARLSHS